MKTITFRSLGLFGGFCKSLSLVPLNSRALSDSAFCSNLPHFVLRAQKVVSWFLGEERTWYSFDYLFAPHLESIRNFLVRSFRLRPSFQGFFLLTYPYPPRSSRKNLATFRRSRSRALHNSDNQYTWGLLFVPSFLPKTYILWTSLQSYAHGFVLFLQNLISSTRKIAYLHSEAGMALQMFLCRIHTCIKRWFSALLNYCAALESLYPKQPTYQTYLQCSQS